MYKNLYATVVCLFFFLRYSKNLPSAVLLRCRIYPLYLYKNEEQSAKIPFTSFLLSTFLLSGSMCTGFSKCV